MIRAAARRVEQRWLHPPAPPGRPFGGLRIAAIVDPFTEACFAPEVTLLPLHARWWRLQLPAFAPQLLLVESAWRGARDSWHRRIASYSGRHDDTLADVVRWSRRHRVPTVFWNKEDPVHFARFIAAARHFDLVFTTCEERVPAYIEAGIGAGRVASMMFAAQPALHLPGPLPRADVVSFAGSYGEAEHGTRRAELEALLDGARGFDLQIHDRRASEPGGTQFPSRFHAAVRPAVPYQALIRHQASVKVALNVNSVRDSRTMFSRRVFELLACETSVVSGPSVGVAALFGDVVDVVERRDEAAAAIHRLLADEPARRARAARGRARVLAAHTYAHRVAQLCHAVGIASAPSSMGQPAP